MKKYIYTMLASLSCLAISNIANAQNWIPYQPYQTQNIQVTNTYPVIIQSVPQPIVVNQWVPFIVPQTTIVEQHCLFRKTQKIITEPVTRWIYMPVVVYK